MLSASKSSQYSALSTAAHRTILSLTTPSPLSKEILCCPYVIGHDGIATYADGPKLMHTRSFCFVRQPTKNSTVPLAAAKPESLYGNNRRAHLCQIESSKYGVYLYFPSRRITVTLSWGRVIVKGSFRTTFKLEISGTTRFGSTSSFIT